MAKPRKPGEIAKKTGEYEERGPKGGKVPDGRTVTVDGTSDKLPPTQKKGQTYVRISSEVAKKTGEYLEWCQIKGDTQGLPGDSTTKPKKGIPDDLRRKKK
jgi:hypothetical protein